MYVAAVVGIVSRYDLSIDGIVDRNKPNKTSAV